MNPEAPDPKPHFGPDFDFERALKAEGKFTLPVLNVEAGLFARIHAAELLGPLADLKREQIPAPAFWERVEAGLAKRIAIHQEYEEPVDHCIADQADEEVRWGRLEHQLEKHIHSLSRLEPWELELKAEKLLLPGQWEHVEAKLQTRVASSTVKTGKPATTTLLGLFWLRRPAVAATVLLVLLTGSAWMFYRHQAPALDTFVYQVQGHAALSYLNQNKLTPLASGKTLRSQSDESMIVVNQRGYVELKNGSQVAIRQANTRKIQYQVGFTHSGSKAQGKVVFFVTHQKHKEKFLVSTPDYQIEVVGTYFQVNSDLEGRYSTSVMEGKVLIHSPTQGVFPLQAGETLVYDIATKQYRVLPGGPVVARQDIERVPPVSDLKDYELLTVVSNAPESEVHIDGKDLGQAPIVILQPLGRHVVSIRKDGYEVLDTSVAIVDGGSNRLVANLISIPSAPARGQKVAALTPAPSGHPVFRLPAATVPRTPTQPTVAASQEAAELYFRQAEQVEGKSWELAVRLYQKVAADSASSSIRKETALFSIARLRAENESEKSQAMAAFQTYLSRYPRGDFAGESLLRLAELEFARNPGKSIVYYLDYFKRYPRSERISELEHRVGLIYLQQKQYDKAIAMLQQSLANVPYGTEAEKRPIYASLQRAFLAKGDTGSAALVKSQYRHADEKGETQGGE